MPCPTYIRLLLLPLLAACSGGGSGDSDDAKGPPPPPFTIVSETGLAVANQFDAVAVLGRMALVPVSEPESATDLNGDGDTSDMVVHRFDVDTLAATNLGLAIRGPILVSETRFAFLVSEHDEQADLNADGDTNDNVWHVYNPAQIVSSTNPRNLQLGTPAAGKPGVGARGGFVLIVNEAAQRTDLNGDQDQADDLVFTFVDGLDALLPIGGPPHAAGTKLVSRDNRVLFTGTEFGALIDYSGDGDASDLVLGAVVFDDFALAIYQPVGPLGPTAIVRDAYELTGTMAVYLTDEAASGASDLNGDGDATDGIITLYDFQNAQGEMYPNDPLLGTKPIAGSRSYGFAAGTNRIIVGVDEGAQNIDYNLDQDKADVILAWIDTENSPRRLHILGQTLGTAKPAVDGNRGLVTVSEAASAFVTGIDFNGDGDIGDEVAFVVNMTSAPGAAFNLGFAAGFVDLKGTDAIVGVVEGGHFGIDQNGDLDLFDVVPFYVDLSVTVPSFRSLGTAAHHHLLVRSPTELRIGLLVPEQPFTLYRDLNGDGDSDDNALLWIDMKTDVAPPIVIPPTPQLIGIGSFLLSPPIVIDPDYILFATSERLAELDLNDDGDTEDTVLRVGFRPPDVD